MNYTLRATIKRILEPQAFDKFTRLDVEVLTIEPKPQPLRFEFYNDNIKKVTDIGEEVDVEITFYLKGNRSKEDKVYNNLVAFDVKRISSL